jgi:hypothetical protein
MIPTAATKATLSDEVLVTEKYIALLPHADMAPYTKNSELLAFLGGHLTKTPSLRKHIRGNAAKDTSHKVPRTETDTAMIRSFHSASGESCHRRSASHSLKSDVNGY